MSANDVNPSTLFGGTWEMFAKGRTIIGKDDTGTFSKLGVTGGSSTQSIKVNAHTHTIAHTHTVNSHTHTLSSHTHTVNAHAHNIVHSHKIGAHGHSIGGTAINASQMANHGHYFNGTQGWRDAVGLTTAGYSGTIYHNYLSIAYNDEGSLGITYSGDSATHSHSCSTTELITNNPTGITNSGNSSPGTGGPSTNNSGASSPSTGGSSNANSGSAGAQTISVNVIQPYIVVNIWKRIA